MNERPEMPPEGSLIKAALTRSGMSVRKAAPLAGLSEGRWRQIVNGYQTPSKGVFIEVNGPPETVARMAKVVGVQSFQLREAGRPDAATALQDMELDEKHGEKTTRELDQQSQAMATEIHELLRRQGRDLDSRQRRVLDRWAKALIETLDDFDSQNNAS